jgi:hypothetical protein
LLLPDELGAALLGLLLAPGGVFLLAGLTLLAARHAQFVTAPIERLAGGLPLAAAVFALALGGPLRLVARHLLGIRAARVRKDLAWPSGRSVRRGHDLLERLEAEIRAAIPNATVLTHLEALEDPAAWQDQGLDRTAPP